jgi:protein KRI1
VQIAGEIPTRFKYIEVPKENFGMTVEEILLADDKELNQKVPLKRLAPYRTNYRKPGNQFRSKQGWSAKQHQFPRQNPKKTFRRESNEEGQALHQPKKRKFQSKQKGKQQQ